MPALFATIDRAVAFDRADYYDVITHQSGGRCCSDAFADALSMALSTEADWFIPCSTGVYTDTAEFTHLIPECTNVSVGYKHQHGDREEQDVAFLQRLAETVVTVDWDALPTARDPKAADADDLWRSSFNSKYAGTGLGMTNSKYDGQSSYKDWRDQRDAFTDYDDAILEGDHPDCFADDTEALLNEKECELFDALEAAIHDENYSWLMDMVAIHALPEDPDWMRTRLSRKKMAKLVHRAFDDLSDGVSADIVLDYLMDGSDV
jgi:hypothetical protein